MGYFKYPYAFLVLISMFTITFGTTENEAEAFLNSYNKRAEEFQRKQANALWTYYKHMTKENQDALSDIEVASSTYNNKITEEAMRFNSTGLRAEISRQIEMLQKSATPTDPEKARKLSYLISSMTKIFGTTKVCDGIENPIIHQCPKNLTLIPDLLSIMALSLNSSRRWFAWNGWHNATGPKVKPLFREYVHISNIGAREHGWADVGQYWRSEYELDRGELVRVMLDLWKELKPLYEKLHAYVRHKLREIYGYNNVRPDGPIPVHLLDMWGFNWNYLSGLIKPYPYKSDVSITDTMKKKNMTVASMTQISENFYVSIGLDKMLPGFWKNSFLSDEGLENVDCSPSAWDVAPGDYRIKMPCIGLDENNLYTLHHEMGHIEYYMMYRQQPYLFRSGANAAFHEALGDAITLSTRVPSYLKSVGLLAKDSKADTDPEIAINSLMKEALHKVAILPFSLVVDLWRWRVFNGEITPDKYNTEWWKLKREYQGVASPQERTEEEFDPGAIAHICNNTPYASYYFGAVVQFQFHEGMCKAAGHIGPLHECSIFRSRRAGAKLRAMLELGRSKPWPDALQVLTGQRSFNSSSIKIYFEPLLKWLDTQQTIEKYPVGW